ncbi:MAG: PstS family phosphate ABC transporter substrate-binding protein [Syntrophales bacterium]|jgi:phosphate transport system substrate-binding protein
MKTFKIIMFSVLCLALFGAGSTLAGKDVMIKGSTTVLPIAQATLEAYIKAHPGVNMSLSGGGSGEGIKALIDKSTDIATSSREIKEDEINLARSKGVNPVEIKVGIDAIVPVVHPSNKVKGLTIDQLSQIYQGKVTNWKEVGGDNKPIVVISRDSSSGTFESWGHLVLNGAKVTPKAQLQASNGAIVQAVSKNKYAIGYIGLGYQNKALKSLMVNGVKATVETAITKEYPISRALYMYTNGQAVGEAAGYIHFVLSPEGQKLVAREGFVPLVAEKEKKPSKRSMKK